jgi:hypothetical protein
MAAVSPELERRGAPSANAVTSGTRAIAGGKPRVVGVDVARGLALIGMMATHAIATLDVNDNPAVATVPASGRATATYVLVAGVSLAFLSGRRTAVRGQERIGVSAGLVSALGLALGGISGHSTGSTGFWPSMVCCFCSRSRCWAVHGSY